jgi:predicted dehydrogenase
VGCGGRGSGAANQALRTEANLKLVAIAELFPETARNALQNLKMQHPDKVDVPEERLFFGFEAYKQAIALADVVILATPCTFRPVMFEEAVRQGKHVFMEKPVALDSPGVRRVLAAAAEAKRFAKCCPKCCKKACAWCWMLMHSMPLPKILGCVIFCAFGLPKNGPP